MLKTYIPRITRVLLLSLLIITSIHTNVSAEHKKTCFTEEDYQTYKALATPSRSDEYQPVLGLIIKLHHTNPASFHLTSNPEVTYDYLLHDLEQRKSTIESIRIKIESINNQIENYQDQLQAPSSNNKELIDCLVNEVNTLTKEDQRKIDDYPLLLSAQEKLTPNRRTQILWIIFTMTLLLALFPISVTIFKKGTYS